MDSSPATPPATPPQRTFVVRLEDVAATLTSLTLNPSVDPPPPPPVFTAAEELSNKTESYQE